MLGIIENSGRKVAGNLTSDNPKIIDSQKKRFWSESAFGMGHSIREGKSTFSVVFPRTYFDFCTATMGSWSIIAKNP